MQRYRFPTQILTPEAPDWHAALHQAHGAKYRPLCLCRDGADSPLMYVARVGDRFTLKRMPSTGPDHRPDCDHYEPPQELSGFGQVNGAAIREDSSTDTTTLALDFALTQGADRAAPTPSGREPDSVRAGGTRLTLRATLHYLYDQAQLTRWTPRMAGRRSWFVVRRAILEAAEGKTTKGKPLNGVLYIPETFRSEDLKAIHERRIQTLAPLATSPARRMIFIAPFKEIQPSNFGHRLILKHMPDMPLQMDSDVHRTFLKRFDNALGLWDAAADSHLLVTGTFSQPQPRVYRLEAITAINLTDQWLPFEDMHDLQLTSELVRTQRRFVKGLRYNLPRDHPLAAAVLQDSQPATALFIVPPDAGGDYRERLQAVLASSHLASWQWDAGSQGLPDLPALVRRCTPQ